MAVTPIYAGGVHAELHTIKPSGRGMGGTYGKDWNDPDVPFSCLSAYAVHVNGERIGAVWSKAGTSHRKSGRLIVATSHPTEWGGTLVGWWCPRQRMGRGEWRPVTDVPKGRYVTVDDRREGGWQRTRADACEMLLRTWRELAS